jgi:flagellar assembly factor FliW
MQIQTTRFGQLAMEVEDVILFPQGLIAFENCRHWLLLADAENDSLGWLQSIARPELALPVISPRRFVPGYQIRVAKTQISPLEMSQFDQAYVLSIINKSAEEFTVNLKAPLIINLDKRIGRQVITSDEQPVALPLRDVERPKLRLSA